MEYLLIILALFSSLFHLVAFGLESVFFLKGAHKRFFVEEEHAEAVYPFAFNQGFYNLCLTVLMIAGLTLNLNGHELGKGMMLSSSFVMVGAGAALAYTDKKLLRVAILQGLPPVFIIYLLLF